MTTKEFIIEKNRIVKRVTRVTLVPEDQIVDEDKVYLDAFYYGSLDAKMCPYCENRRRGFGGSIDCETCPMYRAGNYCDDVESTWKEANARWRKLAKEKDRDELKFLVAVYNNEAEEPVWWKIRRKLGSWFKFIKN